MLVQLRTNSAGLAIVLGAMVQMNLHDLKADPALADNLRRRCLAAPGAGFFHRWDASYIPSRWSTYAVLAPRTGDTAPIGDDSTGIATAFASAIVLLDPERAVEVCIGPPPFRCLGCRSHAFLRVDGTVLDPAVVNGAPRVPPTYYDRTDVARCRVDAGAPSLGCVRGGEGPLTTTNLLVEVRTDLAGLVILLAALVHVNLSDSSMEPTLADDLKRRCSAPPAAGFLYTRDPAYLPDRWSTFSLLSPSTKPGVPIRDDCEGLSSMYGAGIVRLEPQRSVEVVISQPKEGGMAHAWMRVDREVFDPSVVNGMDSPPADFYQRGEVAAFPIEVPQCPPVPVRS